MIVDAFLPQLLVAKYVAIHKLEVHHDMFQARMHQVQLGPAQATRTQFGLMLLISH